MHPAWSKGVGNAGAYPDSLETCRPVIDIADQAILRRFTRSGVLSSRAGATALRLMSSSKLPETITTAYGLNPFSDRTKRRAASRLTKRPPGVPFGPEPLNCLDGPDQP
jgi:hypothetical protein